MNTKDNNSNLSQNISRVKPAAIWARVSTHDQRETSISSQIDRCKVLLEQEGFTVSHALCADWTSLDLFGCPEFQELRSLIKDRDIEALAVFDRDRLEAKGLQRLVFISECKENAVKLIICQGPPILDEPEGQLVELALALGKERSVLRARQGSRDGLRDRALKRRLPTSRHKLYGYRWETERRLIPDDNWPNVKLIFNMLLVGSTYWPIIQELKKRGILSPQGLPEWNKGAISNMVHNPAYTGRYYALKKRAVEPVKRNGNTYGNSSQEKLPLDEWHYISEIEIVDPPITWDQRLQILDQLSKHQKLAQRSARRDYLLRGMIVCGEHFGKNGEPRRYHGQPYRGSWRYTCPVGGCLRPYINGLGIENLAKFVTHFVLHMQPDELYQQLSHGPNRDFTRESIYRELSSLQDKLQRNIDAEVRLEERILFGKVSAEAETRLKEKLRNERLWIEREQAVKLDQAANLDQEELAIASIGEIKQKYCDKLLTDELTQSEWRDIFVTLNLVVRVHSYEEKQDVLEDILASLVVNDIVLTDEVVNGVLKQYEKNLTVADVSIELGIPISPEAIMKVGEIVLAKPEPG